MTTAELIEQLNKITDKTMPVKFFHQNRPGDWLSLPVDTVIENPDHILIGTDIPTECYEYDYKHPDW